MTFWVNKVVLAVHRFSFILRSPWMFKGESLKSPFISVQDTTKLNVIWLQCLHPSSQSKISFLLKVTTQVCFVMHLGPLSRRCFGLMLPVVSGLTAVYWSLPTLTEVKLENTDVKLAMSVQWVHQRLLILLCNVSRFCRRHCIDYSNWWVEQNLFVFWKIKRNTLYSK